jgi:hypothetical protein
MCASAQSTGRLASCRTRDSRFTIAQDARSGSSGRTTHPELEGCRYNGSSPGRQRPQPGNFSGRGGISSKALSADEGYETRPLKKTRLCSIYPIHSSSLKGDEDMLRQRSLKLEILNLLAVTVLLTFFASGVQAQPVGSYRQSCSAPIVQGDTLSTTCRDLRGTFRPAHIENVSTCVGGIFNDDGVLRCSRGAMPPPGSYTQTCDRQYVAGGYLTAVCRKRDGNYIRTTLSYFGCVGDIHNNNGILLCNKTALPSGTYAETCDRTYINGAVLISFCRERGGLLRQTFLPNFQQCVGDIFNDNGVLGCRR